MAFLLCDVLYDKTYKNDSSSYIEPGHYTIVVSLDEFDTLTTEVDINGSEQDLYGSLNPNSTKGREIQEKYTGIINYV